MFGGILSGKRGLAGALLIVVIVWALAAVLMLTGTLISARTIDRDVKIITPETGNIGHNTHLIELAKTTAIVSGKILKAAEPLSGQASQILAAAKTIDGTVNEILNTAHTINTTVAAINGTVASINGNAASIDSHIRSIGSAVSGIHGHVLNINSDVHSINSSAGEINSRLKGVLADTGVILSRVGDIRKRVVRINGQAQTGIDAATAILGDFDGILAGVGTKNGTRTVLGHANSIDCSNLLNTALLGAPTAECNK